MTLNPDDTLLNSHYRIQRLLGRGGFGFVYQAQDTLLGEQVAIKELIPALVGDEAMLKRFLAEARATMRLRHERIVGTHNVFREGGNYYIVMEYMPGGSLEARLQERGSPSAEEAVQVAAEACEGLAYAHEHGVVHCDLKPANILFDKDGHAKVADFGIAHVSGEMLTRTWKTPQGFVAGTLPYMSPEQAEGVRDEPRIDVYAVGAVLYRMLTGRTYLDFDQRETPAAQADNVYLIRNQEPQPPSVHAPGLPAWLDGLVLCVLAKQPGERYASAEAMRAALLRRQPAPALAASPSLLPPTQLTPAGRVAGATPLPTRQAPSRPAGRATPAAARSSPLPAWFWLAVGAAVVLLVFLIMAIVSLSRGRDGIAVAGVGTAIDAGLTEKAVAARTATRTPEREILRTKTRTPTSTPTDTPQPTATPTSTPTGTLEPTATSTSRPTATLQPTPTNTPLPPTSTPKPNAPAAGATRTRSKDGMVMVYVPAGEFMMGSNELDNEKPIHTVTLDAFWIDRTEVTNGQFRKCVEAGTCQAPTTCDGGGGEPTYNDGSKTNHPVVCVNWHQAKAYCEWAGARLPTEAEWEKAARGTDGWIYPWGNDFDCNKGNFDDETEVNDYVVPGGLNCDGYLRIAPVGSFPGGASPYGALDMAGNVLEHVADWYDEDYYANSPAINPKGPNSGDYRVLRGGFWGSRLGSVRAAFRNIQTPAYRFNFTGFRCSAGAGSPGG